MKLGDPIAGRFVAEVGVGMVHTDNFVDRPARPKGVVALEGRVKEALDPVGRFNPGRMLGRP
jgi:FAD/FMN-containing dehydrogenase